MNLSRLYKHKRTIKPRKNIKTIHANPLALFNNIFGKLHNTLNKIQNKLFELITRCKTPIPQDNDPLQQTINNYYNQLEKRHFPIIRALFRRLTGELANMDKISQIIRHNSNDLEKALKVSIKRSSWLSTDYHNCLKEIQQNLMNPIPSAQAPNDQNSINSDESHPTAFTNPQHQLSDDLLETKLKLASYCHEQGLLTKQVSEAIQNLADKQTARETHGALKELLSYVDKNDLNEALKNKHVINRLFPNSTQMNIMNRPEFFAYLFQCYLDLTKKPFIKKPPYNSNHEALTTLAGEENNSTFVKMLHHHCLTSYSYQNMISDLRQKQWHIAHSQLVHNQSVGTKYMLLDHIFFMVQESRPAKLSPQLTINRENYLSQQLYNLINNKTDNTLSDVEDEQVKYERVKVDLGVYIDSIRDYYIEHKIPTPIQNPGASADNDSTTEQTCLNHKPF